MHAFTILCNRWMDEEKRRVEENICNLEQVEFIRQETEVGCKFIVILQSKYRRENVV